MAAKDLYEKDFYAILGVDKKATADEIKKKYRSLARELHPDKTKGDDALEEKFKAVSEAYDILSDSKKRADSLSVADSAGLWGVAAVAAAEISPISSVVDHLTTSLQTCLAEAEYAAVHAKGKIYRLNQQLHLRNQLQEQRSG
jgi:curved DNA-binding protein CbpA